MNLQRETAAKRIRVGVLEDAPSIAAVLLEAFMEYKSLYTPEGFAATTPSSAHIGDRLKEGPVWVVICNHVIVGTVSVVPRNDSFYVRGMAIVPSARGQRVGELLLRQVERYASELSYNRLLLSTTPFLGRAIRLYEHHGFRRTSEGPDNLFGTPIFTMEKLLDLQPRH